MSRSTYFRPSRAQQINKTVSTQRGEKQTHLVPAETHSRSALSACSGGDRSLCFGTRTGPAASRAGTAGELLGTSPASMAGFGRGDLTITPAHGVAHTV